MRHIDLRSYTPGPLRVHPISRRSRCPLQPCSSRLHAGWRRYGSGLLRTPRGQPRKLNRRSRAGRFGALAAELFRWSRHEHGDSAVQGRVAGDAGAAFGEMPYLHIARACLRIVKGEGAGCSRASLSAPSLTEFPRSRIRHQGFKSSPGRPLARVARVSLISYSTGGSSMR